MWKRGRGKMRANLEIQEEEEMERECILRTRGRKKQRVEEKRAPVASNFRRKEMTAI